MADPKRATSSQIDWWTDVDGSRPDAVVIGGPSEAPDVIPCPALVNSELGMVHVAYQLDEIELVHLARGGTLWLTTWGMVPVHRLEVQLPESTS